MANKTTIVFVKFTDILTIIMILMVILLNNINE